jgi:hypothetical protein
MRLSFLARPLLAFRRDLSRPTSETRSSADPDEICTYRTRQESTSSSSPLEIIDVDSTGSFKSLLDKVKNTLSPATKRRTSENSTAYETSIPVGVNTHAEADSTPTTKSRQHTLRHHKSVSFADAVDSSSESDINYSVDDHNEIVRNAQLLADQILVAGIDQVTTQTPASNGPAVCSTDDTSEDSFQRDFHRTIKARQLSGDNPEALIYQDLSAEIVAYVLKHALRTVKKEQELAALTIQTQPSKPTNDRDDEFIDLK